MSLVSDLAPRRVTAAYGWYALAVLFVAYVFAFIDRQALNLLVEPIKRDLQLDDVQASLLQGLAFAIFLSVGAFPAGRLVDTGRRTGVLGGGLAAWSAMTAVCGLARGFAPLLGARIGVGVGEAAMTPSAYSLIGDYFPPRRLGLAIGVFSTGAYLGSGLALLFGAAVIGAVPRGGVTLPLLGPVHGWQLTFLLIGAAGFPAALWVASLREPPRRRSGPLEAPPLAEALAWFAGRWRAILLCNLAVGFAAMTAYAILAWYPSLLMRAFGLPTREVGMMLGPIVMFGGAGGTFAAGLVGDALRKRWTDGRLRVMLISALVAAPLVALSALAGRPVELLALLAPALFTVTLVVGSGPAILQEITPNRMVGLQHALAVFVGNVLGLGLGPTAIALITDHVLRDERRLGTALAIGLPIMMLISASCALAAARPYRDAAASGTLAFDLGLRGGAAELRPSSSPQPDHAL
jgi:MFS family permease